jgi:predicted double-glycine peptidase
MVSEPSGSAAVMKRRLGGAALFILASVASGCGYLGSARSMDLETFDREPGWMAVRDVQFQKQKSDNDCGAASVAMVLTHWGHPSTPEDVIAGCPTSKEGMRAGDLRDLIKNRGLKGFLIHGNIEDLKTELNARRPVIVGLIKPYSNGGLSHYEVVVGINLEQKRVATLDPARGPRQNTFEGFLQEWEPTGSLTIVVIGNERTDPDRKESRIRHSLLLEGGNRKRDAYSALSPLMAAPDPHSPWGSRRLPNMPRMQQPFELYTVQGSEGSEEVSGARFD